MSAFIRLLAAFLVICALCSAAKMPFKLPVKPSALKGAPVKPSIVKGAPVKPSAVKGAPVKPSVVKGALVKPSAVKGALVKPVSVTVSKPVSKSAIVSKSTQKNVAVTTNSNLYGNLLAKNEEKPLILSAVKKVPVAEADSEAYNTDYKTTIGVTAPLGFYDPLGLLKNPAVSEERFQRLRKTEIKHGRISMLAILGHIMTTNGMRLPGNIWFDVPFSSVKNGLAAFDTIPIPFTVCLIAFIGLLDTGFNRVKEGIEQDCVDYMNGVNWSEEKQNYKRNIELNQGRAAQMGILALMVHEKLDNNPYIINDLLGFPVPFNP